MPLSQVSSPGAGWTQGSPSGTIGTGENIQTTYWWYEPVTAAPAAAAPAAAVSSPPTVASAAATGGGAPVSDAFGGVQERRPGMFSGMWDSIPYQGGRPDMQLGFAQEATPPALFATPTAAPSWEDVMGQWATSSAAGQPVWTAPLSADLQQYLTQTYGDAWRAPVAQALQELYQTGGAQYSAEQLGGAGAGTSGDPQVWQAVIRGLEQAGAIDPYVAQQIPERWQQAAERQRHIAEEETGTGLSSTFNWIGEEALPIIVPALLAWMTAGAYGPAVAGATAGTGAAAAAPAITGALTGATMAGVMGQDIGKGALMGGIGGGLGSAIGYGANAIAPETWASMSQAMQQAVVKIGSELITAGVQERDIDWKTIAASVASGAAGGDMFGPAGGDLSQPDFSAGYYGGTGEAVGLGETAPGMFGAAGAPLAEQLPEFNLGGAMMVPGFMDAESPEAALEALARAGYTGTEGLSYAPAVPAAPAAPEQPAPEEQSVVAKAVAKYGPALLERALGMLGGRPKDAPQRDEGESEEQYFQEVAGYLDIDTSGLQPGTPEFYAKVQTETDRIIAEMLGGDAEFLQGATAEELQQALSGKRQDELLQLRRALFVRGQLESVSTAPKAVNPFTGQEEELGGMFGAVPAALAATQRGYERESEALSGLRGREAREYFGGLLGRKADLFGLQASADARALRARLAMEEEELRRRRGIAGPAASEGAYLQDLLGGYSDEELRGVLGRYGSEDEQAAALAQLLGV